LLQAQTTNQAPDFRAGLAERDSSVSRKQNDQNDGSTVVQEYIDTIADGNRGNGNSVDDEYIDIDTRVEGNRGNGNSVGDEYIDIDTRVDGDKGNENSVDDEYIDIDTRADGNRGNGNSVDDEYIDIDTRTNYSGDTSDIIEADRNHVIDIMDYGQDNIVRENFDAPTLGSRKETNRDNFLAFQVSDAYSNELADAHVSSKLFNDRRRGGGGGGGGGGVEIPAQDKYKRGARPERPVAEDRKKMQRQCHLGFTTITFLDLEIIKMNDQQTCNNFLFSLLYSLDVLHVNWASFAFEYDDVERDIAMFHQYLTTYIQRTVPKSKQRKMIDCLCGGTDNAAILEMVTEIFHVNLIYIKNLQPGSDSVTPESVNIYPLKTKFNVCKKTIFIINDTPTYLTRANILHKKFWKEFFIFLFHSKIKLSVARELISLLDINVCIDVKTKKTIMQETVLPHIHKTFNE
jgi:hypothetical protein